MQQGEQTGIMSLIDQLNLVEGELSSIDPEAGDDVKAKMDMIKERLISLLAEAIKSFDIETRRGAAYGLSKIQDKSAIPILREATKDADDVVRSWACEGLGYLKDPDNISFLVEAIFDKCIYVYYNASTALKKYNSCEVWPAIEIRMMNLNEKAHLKRIVKFAGEMREKAAVPYIREFILSEDDEFRYECVEALRKIADINSCDILIESLKDSSRDVVACSIQAIKLLKDERALGHLIQISLENVEHRDLALQAIEEIAGVNAVEKVHCAIGKVSQLVVDTTDSILSNNTEKLRIV